MHLHDFIIFACFALVLYFYIEQNNQFMTTASAIRSVFTGECQMACRQSGSGYSAFSNMVPGTSHNYDRIGPNCICDSCPCHLIENFIRTCSPVTRMYTAFTSMLSQFYCNIITSMCNAYGNACKVVKCRLTCRKSRTVCTTNYDSHENFSFKERDKDDIASMRVPPQINEEKQPKKKPGVLASLKDKILSKSSLNLKKPGICFKGKDRTDSSSGDESDQPQVKPQGGMVSASTSVATGDCPKCVAKGQVCLSECPHAKK